MTGGSRLLRSLLIAAAVIAGSGCSGEAAAPRGDVYRVEIEACAGVSHQRATAMAVAPNLAATAAHTFESARGAVLRTADGVELDTEVVFLDPDRDIALLFLDDEADRVFALAEAVDDTEVTISTYAQSEGVTTKEGIVLRSVDATLDGEGRRRAVEISASIENGDSGAPVIDDDGRAIGMVFASSRRVDRGWAVAAVELEEALDAFVGGEGDPPPSPCTG